ncbi:MAG: hypothetical protein DDT39_00058 [Firmicutes bacterium]|nr:hypothetical protein [candidate division NPL-UPA2 bacterium]
MGRAYYRVRVNFDDNVRGEVDICSPRSQDVVLDPSVDTYNTKKWPQFFHRRYVSHHDLVAMFGKAAADEVGYAPVPDWYVYEDTFTAQQMGQLPHYHDPAAQLPLRRAHLLIEREYRDMAVKDVFIDVETGDTSEIPETWDRDRVVRVLELTPGLSTTRRKVETIRWAVTCGRHVLHKKDSPYKNFTIVPFFPSFVDGVSVGGVQSLLDPQQLYNKITSQELHIINTTANSGWKVKVGALKNMTIEELEQAGAKSGFVAELDDVSNMEKIQPNATPQGHDRLSFKADQIMRQLSGVSNQARGFAREDVAGEAIMANQAAQDVNSAGWLANLHRTKQMLAGVVIDCVQAYYDDTRTIVINRGSAFRPNFDTVTINQPTPEGQVINDVTNGKFTTVLVPAPSRSTLSEEDFKTLVMLKKDLGIQIPDAMLLELSPASNKGQIIQAITQDSNEAAAAQREIETAAQQAEIEKLRASAKKEDTAALLNQARAEKFAVEAASDPDASYERVEMTRLQIEQEDRRENRALRRREIDDREQHRQNQIALGLAGLENDRYLAEKQLNTSPTRQE